MLTIKSNLSIFKDRQGSYYTADDLTRLHKNLISTDVVNFKGGISYGYTDTVAEKIVAKLTINKDSKIIIVNDLSLHMLNNLLEAGYKLENIYLAYGKWNKDATPKDDKIVYNIMKAFIKANFEEDLNIITLEEMLNMKIKIDGIIANPPYNTIGANITDTIRKTVDYGQFVNLLPANDYKRNKTKDLFNYQSEMEAINDGFDDAAVTTHLCLVNKNKANNMTLDEFERSQYIDPSLNKYFEVNSKRSHYAIDNHICKPKIARFRTIDLRKCFYTGKRDLAAGHLPYSKDTMSYKINFNLLTDHDEFLANSSKSEQALGNSGNYTVVPFNTEIEKDNLINFLYSNTGFRFISKLFTAINVDCYVVPSKYLPKVDWTRSWTVEEILADYGYTADEIAEVIADLVNFKGMDD